LFAIYPMLLSRCDGYTEGRGHVPPVLPGVLLVHCPWVVSACGLVVCDWDGSGLAPLVSGDAGEDVAYAADNWWLNYGRLSLVNVSKCRSNLSCLSEYFAARERSTSDTWGATGSVNDDKEDMRGFDGELIGRRLEGGCHVGWTHGGGLGGVDLQSLSSMTATWLFGGETVCDSPNCMLFSHR
jgi:hypothetical protein